MAATNTVELEMFVPGTPAWLRTNIQSAYLSLVGINEDARRFHRVAQELIKHKAWELYFDDEPKTWERLLVEGIEVEDVQEAIDILSGAQQALKEGISDAIPKSYSPVQFTLREIKSRLSPDEIRELVTLLTKDDGGLTT